MGTTVFKRKIYNEILEWKNNRSDKYALLIRGARRVGKSTIVEEFASKEFRTYIYCLILLVPVKISITYSRICIVWIFLSPIATADWC